MQEFPGLQSQEKQWASHCFMCGGPSLACFTTANSSCYSALSGVHDPTNAIGYTFLHPDPLMVHSFLTLLLFLHSCMLLHVYTFSSMWEISSISAPCFLTNPTQVMHEAMCGTPSHSHNMALWFSLNLSPIWASPQVYDKEWLKFPQDYIETMSRPLGLLHPNVTIWTPVYLSAEPAAEVCQQMWYRTLVHRIHTLNICHTLWPSTHDSS